MRIGISTLIVRPGVSGSNESYLINLVAGLQAVDQGNDYLLFVTPQNEHLFAALEDRFRLFRVPALAHHRLVRICFDQFVLPFWARALGMDVLHYPGTVGSAVTLKKPRQVVTVHYDLDPIHTLSVPRIKRAYFAALMRRTRRTARVLVVPSRSFADTFAARWNIPEGKIRVVYHGVNRQSDAGPGEGESHTQVLRSFSLKPGYILSVTNALPHKNVPRLLEAYAQVTARWPEVGPLVLAGSIPAEAVSAWKAQLAEKGIAMPWERLVLAGFLPSRQVEILYQYAAVMITPTLTESSSMPVLEAMANGCPVVASDIPVHREIGGEAAVLVPADSATQLADACTRILGDEEWRATLVARGRQRAADFSWERTAEAMIDGYRQAAGSADFHCRPKMSG